MPAGRVFHSASPDVGRFECSDPPLNQLMQNILWTQRGNLHELAERLPAARRAAGLDGRHPGVLADRHVSTWTWPPSSPSGVQDIRDDQADDGRFPDFAPHPVDPERSASRGVPAWGDAGVIVPWRVYQNYGDTRLLGGAFRRRPPLGRLRPPPQPRPDLAHAAATTTTTIGSTATTSNQAGWPKPGRRSAQRGFRHGVLRPLDGTGREDGRRARPQGRSAPSYGELAEQIKSRVQPRSSCKPDGRIAGRHARRLCPGAAASTCCRTTSARRPAAHARQASSRYQRPPLHRHPDHPPPHARTDPRTATPTSPGSC